ncbi:MAG: UDP-N-acetylmuramate dehydrogenase [Treponemataceae bacterium]
MMSIKEKILSSLDFGKIKKSVFFGTSLKNKNSFKIGGKADIFFKPKTYSDLVFGLNFFARLKLPISVLGAGTNLLVSDTGIEGVVVSLEKLKGFQQVSDNRIQVEAGLKTEKLSLLCANKGLKGFENFGGLPGTIGGAIFMNARCYGSEIAMLLKSVKTLKFKAGTFSESLYEFSSEDWAYKKTPFQKFRSGVLLEDGASLIVSAVFAVEAGNSKELKKVRKMRIVDRREKGHFNMPSCGSTFKNNHNFGKPSGAIIDELGLKGLTVGGAQVAPFHANFIINKNNASAQDVKKLIEKVQAEVKAKRGFDLEPEVIFAGRW